jgi:L-alanine-DL-glutamate epimerase-like enolase superfamily enzyme
VCVAVFEFAVLDLLGHIAGKPVGELLGTIVRREIEIYRASGRRGNTAQEEMEYLQKIIAQTGAKAVKYRLGGRMQYDETTRRRDEELIPLSRKVLGDDCTIYVDANGSFDIAEAVRMGKILEEHRINFFEEPCPFDHYDETKRVADALSIPIAGGEQESSLRQFQSMIERDAVQVVQPDPLMFGGMIRAIKVARMAQVAGIDATPHMSGYGLGYLYVLHYASCVPNAGRFQEYKGDDDPVPFECPTSSLKTTAGVMNVPTGPGLGIRLDPDFLAKGKMVGVE